MDPAPPSKLTLAAPRPAAAGGDAPPDRAVGEMPGSLGSARLLCFVGAVLYPLWGLVFRASLPGAVDPESERLAIALACLTIGVASYASRAFARRIHAAMISIYWIATIHGFVLTARNHLAPEYAIGTLVAAACFAAAFLSRKALACYVVGVTIAASATAIVSEAPLGLRLSFSAGLATTMLVAFIALGARLETAASLRREQARLRATFDALRQGVVVHGPDGAVTAWNRAALESLGVTEGDLTGRDSSDARWGLVDEHGLALPAAELPPRIAARTGEPVEGRILGFRRPSGELRWLRVSAVPILDSGRRARQVVVAFEDVTEERRLEAQLRLADRLVSVGTLAAGVAHEINNPLTYVIGNLELMADVARAARVACTMDAPVARELEESIAQGLEGAGRVRDIVADLRTFARPEDATRGPVDLEKVIATAVRLTRADVKHKARVALGSLALPPVVGNASRLGQVFVNLIINAVQAMPPERSADANEVAIEGRVEGGLACVLVRDNGVGVPADLLSRIFDPFFTTKPAGKGTGLGLTVCHGIVTAAGGSIRLASEAGRGTTFTVCLPLAPEEPAAATPVAARAVEAARPPPTSGAARARVLVIDGDARVGEWVRRLLAGRYDVDAVTGEGEALRRIALGEPFDAVICDAMTPGRSGPDFMDELRRVQPGLAVRTGFISGGVVTDRARGLLDGAAARVLQKPFGEAEITALVERLLRP